MRMPKETRNVENGIEEIRLKAIQMSLHESFYRRWHIVQFEVTLTSPTLTIIDLTTQNTHTRRGLGLLFWMMTDGGM